VRRLLGVLEEPVFRRRWWTTIALIVAVAGAVTVTVVVHEGGSTASAAQTVPKMVATTPSATTSGVPTSHHASPSARGQITIVDGDRWTLSATGGATITVALSEHTKFGTLKRPAVRAQFGVGTQVAVIGALSGNTVIADHIIIPITHGTATAPVPAPPTTTPVPAPPTTTPAPAPAPVVNSCAVSAALSQALGYATARGERASLAVYDTATGTYTAAGDADAEYSTASVVKVLVATDLLLTGQMTGDTASTAYQMITASDDDDADALYGMVGGDSVITTIADHYGITNLGSPPADTGQWGETKITADGLVHLYAKLKTDPQVWPWLSDAMSNTTRRGTDSTDQFFGIPSAAQDWAVKQGWMTGLGPGSTYDSTGYVDGNRYAVVILTYGSVAQYGQYMSNTITQMAKDALPGGTIGAPSPSCPA